MLKGYAGEGSQPVMDVKNIKFNLTAYIRHPLLQKMVKQKNPREKVWMPQLRNSTVNFNPIHLLIGWRPGKV
jgi:nicotinamide mononucleotide adenylyltransferase